MTKNTHRKLVNKALSHKAVREAYEELASEFEILKEMIRAREKAGKTQEDVAKAMKTSTSVIGRLESSGGKNHHSPTLQTLRKYAQAIGCDLKIKLVQHK
jgi:ribosome-binding protein aMBF1 (putative translation factor)